MFLADVLVEVGELPAADRAIDAAFAIAADQGDLKSRDYATWTAAALAAAREDPHLTERLLGEVERDHGDWFTSHLGVYFLADAAVLLDRVGLRAPARRSLGLARARGGIGDDYVIQAEAAIAGRSGGAIVRMLAVNEHGLPIDGVLDALFGEVDATRARQRLRQVLLRLRAAGPELVVRDGERLRLAPAWVDVREFDSLARAARATRGERARLFAYAALGLTGRGPLLPSDPYASWAEPARARAAEAIAGLEAILAAG